MKTRKRFKQRSIHAVLSIGLWLAGLPMFAQQPFVVEGEIEGLEDGISLQLLKQEGEMLYKVAEDTVRRGTFRLQSTAESNSVYNLLVFSEGEIVYPYRTVWLQAGDKVRLTGKGLFCTAWEIESENPLQAEQLVYDQAAQAEELEFGRLNLQLEGLAGRKHRLPVSESKTLDDSIRHLEKYMETLMFQMMGKRFETLRRCYLHQGRVGELTACGGFLLKNIARYVSMGDAFPYADEVKEFFRRLPEKQRHTVEMQTIHRLLDPPHVVQAGEPMYDEAVLYDLQGGKHRLSDYNRGKYLLLDFWSSACVPCLSSFPELAEMSDALSDSLVVVSINIDTREQWMKASGQHSITWPNLNDMSLSTGIFSHYTTGEIPSYVLISPEGRVEKTFHGYSKGRIKQKLSGTFPQLRQKNNI